MAVNQEALKGIIQSQPPLYHPTVTLPPPHSHTHTHTHTHTLSLSLSLSLNPAHMHCTHTVTAPSLGEIEEYKPHMSLLFLGDLEVK